MLTATARATPLAAGELTNWPPWKTRWVTEPGDRGRGGFKSSLILAIFASLSSLPAHQYQGTCVPGSCGGSSELLDGSSGVQHLEAGTP